MAGELEVAREIHHCVFQIRSSGYKELLSDQLSIFLYSDYPAIYKQS